MADFCRFKRISYLGPIGVVRLLIVPPPPSHLSTKILSRVLFLLPCVVGSALLRVSAVLVLRCLPLLHWSVLDLGLVGVVRNASYV